MARQWRRIIDRSLWASVAVMLIALCFCLIFAHPGIPSDEPDEANRITHPEGFSIDVPRKWDVAMNNRGPSLPWIGIQATPKIRVVARRHASFAVLLISEPPDVTDFTPTTFQESTAFWKIERREWTGDDPSRLSCSLLFQRDGKWFALGYHRVPDPGGLPPIIQRYFDTFRIEPKQAEGDHRLSHAPLLPASAFAKRQIRAAGN